MIIKNSKRIDRYRIFTEIDNRGRTIVIVYLDYIPIVRYDQDKLPERKLAAVELVELYQCNIAIAAKICGFHRNSVFKYVRIKRLLGIEALFEDDRGPKAPYKYVGIIRQQIKSLIRKYPNQTDQEIADMGSIELEVVISRSAVARIRTENEDKKKDRNRLTKLELINLTRAAEKFEEEQYQKKQLLLNFNWDSELKEKTQKFSHEESPKAQKRSQGEYIKSLNDGMRSIFAGNLMHHLFLEEIGFNNFFEDYPIKQGFSYQARDIYLTLFHSITYGIQSIEALKLVNATELGVIMGLNRSPDKEVIRDHLNEMSELNLSGDLIDKFARILLEKKRINPEVFFVDGHFLPYYGLHIIAKGYYTVRRLSMRGNEIYAVTDLQGRPLFSITESNEIDFRPILLQCANKLIELGIKRPIMVFDRGGYGIEFFKKVGINADFVTWSKYVGEKQLSKIAKESFQVGFQYKNRRYIVSEEIRIVKESIQTAKSNGRKNATSMELRLVVIEDIKEGKRLGIYTNNRTKGSWEIALYMLERWGDSENFFKEMGKRFNINYHPGYDIQELEKQPLIDNPDIELINKAIKILNKEIKEIKQEKELIELKQKNRPDKRLIQKLDHLKKDLEEKQIDIQGFSEKKALLPDKVSIIEILKGKPMSRCDLEKKKIYDFIQYMSYHSRERLVEEFKKCYEDLRDIKQVLDMITNQGGFLKLIGKTLVVVIDWIELKKHREAACKLFEILNNKKIIMVGNLEVKLFFCLSKIPKSKR